MFKEDQISGSHRRRAGDTSTSGSFLCIFLLGSKGIGNYVIWGREKSVKSIVFSTTTLFIWIALIASPLDHLQAERSPSGEAWVAPVLSSTSDVDSAQVHCALGYRYLEMDELESAEREFKKALKFNRKLPEAYNGLGLCFFQRKRAKQWAIENFKKAIRLDPKYVEARFNLGLTYLDLELDKEAFGQFEKVVQLDPQHPKAYFYLGMIDKRNTFLHRVILDPKRAERAIEAFSKHIEISPQDFQAYLEAAELCYFKDEFTRGSEFLEELIDQTQDSLKAFVFLAWCQAGNKEYDQAFKSFVRVFEFLGDDEKSLYTEPIYLISKSESKRYSHLPAEERRRFWQSYWKMRDPEPLTDVNERLVEHYVRVSYSRTYFSQKQYPWDRRGEIFVRYGEPDYRSFTGGIEKIYDTDTQARVETGAIWRASDYKKSLDKYGLRSIPFENWIYFDLWGGKPAELVFSDNTLSGKYDYPFPSKRTSPTSVTYSPAMVAEEIIAETPETFHYDYGGEPLDFPFDLADFRGKGGQSAVEVYYGVLISQLEVSEETEKAWVETGIALFDQDWHVVSKMSEETVIPLPPATDRSEGSLAVNLLRLSVPAGEYHLAIQIKDEVSGKIGIYKRDISIEDYTPKSLTLSDIQLAGSVAPSLKEGRFTKRGLSVIPFPTKRYRQSQLVYIYYEIYNLSKDKYGRTHFQTDYTVASLLGEKNVVSQIVSGLGSLIGVDRKKGEITVSYEDRGTSGTEIGYTSIDMRDSPPGEYQLMVAVEDLNRGEKVKKSIVFTLLE